MSQQISALKRIITKEEQNKFKEIILKNLNQVYIGRDIDCNYRITSIEISRKHAVIKYIDNYWTITDLASTNGLFVNAIQLVSYTPQRLSNGDRVSFGPPNQSEFNYQFIEKYSPNLNNNNISYGLSGINLTSIPVIPIVTRIQSDSTEQLLPSNTVRFNIEPNVSGTISLSTNMPTRSGVNYQINSVSSSRSPRMSVSTNSNVNTSSFQHRRQSSRSKHNTTNRSVDHFIEHDYSRSSSAIVSNEPVIQNKSSHKSSKRSKSSPLKLKDSPNKSKDLRVYELEKKRIAKEMERLEKAKQELEEKKEIEKMKIKQKEDVLKAKMKELDKKEKETQKREEEIEKLRIKLSEEKKKLIEEKSKLIKDSEESRRSSKRKLRSDSIYELNEMKRQCNDGKDDKEVKDKEKLMEDIFESELTCSVCHEFFIHAVNLNCSHTFCHACIEQWKSSNGGNNVCPICRNEIENQNRELVLDNVIERFIVKMKPQVLEHRNKLIDERKKFVFKPYESNSSRRNRDILPNIIPRIHFFLRDAIEGSDSDSEPDSDDVNVIGFGYTDRSSYVSSSSDESIDSEQQSSDSSNDDNSSDESNEHQTSDDDNDVNSLSSIGSSFHSLDSEVEDLESSRSYVSLSSDNPIDSDSDLESSYGAGSEQSLDIDFNESDSYLSD
jgi:pSer/pThr/pTyr-binding forkhead associated (FHA) protein